MIKIYLKLLTGLLVSVLIFSCSKNTRDAMVGKLTGCPPYQEEVAFPSTYENVETASGKPDKETVTPDYLDKMYKEVRDDFEDSDIELEEITNGFKAKGIIIERQVGEDGNTRELTVSLDGDIAFASGSDKLTPKARELVSKLGDALNEYPSTLAKIEGHTDAQGSAVSNQALSQRRAISVKNELINNKGVAAKRIIEAVGYGEEKLLIKNAVTPAQHAKNRRVEIKIVPDASKAASNFHSEQVAYAVSCS